MRKGKLKHRILLLTLIKKKIILSSSLPSYALRLVQMKVQRTNHIQGKQKATLDFSWCKLQYVALSNSSLDINLFANCL